MSSNTTTNDTSTPSSGGGFVGTGSSNVPKTGGVTGAATSTKKLSVLTNASSNNNEKGSSSTNTTTNTTPNQTIPFPQSNIIPTDNNISTYIKPLQDENSSYQAVTKSCFYFCQYAGTGCSSNTAMSGDSTTSSSGSNNSSVLFHDGSYVEFIQTIYPALIQCSKEHIDRRCRIIALQTLAVTARTSYARIRCSPLIYSQREPMTINRIEDEMAMEIPSSLISTALTDDDDGVAAMAIEGLGTITLSSCTTVGNTLLEDELVREIQSIAFSKISVYSPTLRSVCDEDPIVAIQELQYRIYENCIIPRLLHLLDRIIRMKSPGTYWVRCLPIITAVMIHNLKRSPALLHNTDRTIFSKNWSEFDAIGLIDTVVTAIILPSIQSTTPGGGNGTSLAHCAALLGIQFANACPHRPWVPLVAQWATIVLREEVQDSNHRISTTTTNNALNLLSSSTEHKLTTMASLLIATRAIPIADRESILIWIAEEMSTTLPSTTIAPVGVSNAGLLTESISGGFHQQSHYRRPARIGLWTEIALSFFMDGPESLSTSQQQQQQQQSTGTSRPGPGFSTCRSDCLRNFLSTPQIVQIYTEIDITNTSVLTPKDEMILAFTTVAIQSGRRFRITADDTIQVANPNCTKVQEWVKLTWIVLTSFVTCVHSGPPTATTLLYLEEDLSLVTACLASYGQLLQEFLHFVGLLNPVSSVALKLGANACPPHILWDQMTASADFLCKFQSSDLDVIDLTSKLMDELVARELRQGIPSHHMRLFIVTLAADHWVQGRVNAIRKHQILQTTLGAGAAPPAKIDIAILNTTSAREILLSLAPKRLLAKISRAHVPPVDSDGKPKRDPIRKLALECVRVCVACIENIALMACDWRRRFGSSQESKHIVNIAVGLLQGKIDETVPDELAKSVIGPTCEEAISRIQAFYEEKGSSTTSVNAESGFPQSELILQQVKVKIKPLVSPTKAIVRKRDIVMRDYLMQLCRQIALGRCIQCIQSCPPADSLQQPSRPSNCWFRLGVPPMPEVKDGRMYGHRSSALSAWGTSVIAVSAGSDPVQVVLGYTLRRVLRYDGEEEYRVTVLMRAHNMTAVDFEHGLRLELSMIHNNLDPTETEDPMSIKLIESIGLNLDDILMDYPMFSTSIVFKDVIKPGDYVTWEVTLPDVPPTCCSSLVPTIVFRNISMEAEDVGAKWVGETTLHNTSEQNRGEGANATNGVGESADGESDFHVTTTNENSAVTSFNSQNSTPVEVDDVRIPMEVLPISPMIRFQPCPLVFFNDRCGDVDSFRLLWFRMPHQLAPLKLVGNPNSATPIDLAQPDETARTIAIMSELSWDGEAIPGGTASKLWAFMTLSGHRVYCVLTETTDIDGDNNNETNPKWSLHFKSDDKASLYCIAGSKVSREAVVEALVPGMVPQSYYAVLSINKSM